MYKRQLLDLTGYNGTDAVPDIPAPLQQADGQLRSFFCQTVSGHQAADAAADDGNIRCV